MKHVLQHMTLPIPGGFSAYSLSKVARLHGATVSPRLTKRQVTHVVCTQLSGTKERHALTDAPCFSIVFVCLCFICLSVVAETVIFALVVLVAVNVALSLIVVVEVAAIVVVVVVVFFCRFCCCWFLLLLLLLAGCPTDWYLIWY